MQTLGDAALGLEDVVKPAFYDGEHSVGLIAIYPTFCAPLMATTPVSDLDLRKLSIGFNRFCR